MHSEPEKPTDQSKANAPPRRVGFVYDDVYLEHQTGPGHVERPERLEKSRLAVSFELEADRMPGSGSRRSTLWTTSGGWNKAAKETCATSTRSIRPSRAGRTRWP